MANELATVVDTRRLIASLRDGALVAIKTPEEAQAIARQCAMLRRPATSEWLRGRIGTLLAQYFVSPLPPEMVRAISEDWLAVLGEPPEWAVTNACRWWIGPNNPERKRKPQAGDIAARVRFELGPVSMAEVKVAAFKESEARPECARTEAETQRMAEAGQRAIDALRARAGAQ